MNDRQSSDPIRPTRRAFVHGTSAAVIAGSVTSLVAPVHAAGTDTLKLALVGCGNRGTGAAAQALQTTAPVKLVAMADAFRDRLEGSLAILQNGGNVPTGPVPASISARVDVPQDRQFVGLDAYRHAIDAADVVLLCGPPGFRPAQFEYAVERGKHVFMEKPVATDAPGVRRVLVAGKVAESKGLKIGVGLQRHHEAKYQETIHRLRDGAIGDVRSLRCFWNGGTIKQPIDRGGLTEMEYQVRNWYFFAWLSGDHIVEQHVHNLDVCNWLMDAHPIAAVGMGGRQMRIGKNYGDIFDHHAVEYTYPNGTKMFGFCRQMPGCEQLIGEYAVGARGDADLGAGLIRATDGEWRFPRARSGEQSRAANPYQVEHDDFFAAILNNAAYNETESGATATMTAILGRTATYTGRTVKWDEALASTRSWAPETTDGWDTQPLTLPDEAGLYRLPQPGLVRDV